MKINSEETPRTCSSCGKSFNYKHVLIARLRIHTRERPYSCSMCDQSFHQQGGLVYHMLSHSNQKPYRCLYCGKGFKKTSHLKEHFKCHAEENENSICSSHMRIQTSQVLDESHVRKTDSAAVSSSLCNSSSTTVDDTAANESFSAQDSLWSDTKLHTKEKPFIINIKVEEF